MTTFRVGAEISGSGIGPEDLRIPMEPGQLRQAAQQARRLAELLEGGKKEVSSGRDADGGATTEAVRAVARRHSRRLGRDSQVFHDIAESVAEVSRVLEDLQGSELAPLRDRWRQAKHDLIDELERERRHKDSLIQADPVARGGAALRADTEGDVDYRGNVAALANDLDAEVAGPYEDLFGRLFGRSVMGGFNGGSRGEVLDKAEFAQATENYKQKVRAILEEFAEGIRRLERADDRLEHSLQFPHGGDPDDDGDDDGDGPTFSAGADGVVSRPRELREIVEDLRGFGRVHEDAEQAFGAFARGLADGRLPGRGRQDESWAGEWRQYFGRRSNRVTTVVQRTEEAADKLAQLDKEIADAIRPGR